MDQFFGNHSFMWLPIAIFSFIVIFAAVTGWVNGWKTSLYFFGWNLAGLISGVLLTPSIISGLDEVNSIKAIIISAEELAGMLILFIYLIVINFVAFCFYWIFRDKLKKSMINNKKQGKSNAFSRFIGLGITIASASPSAVFIADTSAVMSSKNGYTDFLDTLVKGYTLKKYDGSADARLFASGMDSVVKLFTALSTGDLSKVDIDDLGPALSPILNSGLANKLDDIYGAVAGMNILGHSIPPVTDISQTDLDKLKATPIHLTIDKERKDELKESVGNMFKGDQAKTTAILSFLGIS